jgi:hypothetical protein
MSEYGYGIQWNLFCLIYRRVILHWEATCVSTRLEKDDSITIYRVVHRGDMDVGVEKSGSDFSFSPICNTVTIRRPSDKSLAVKSASSVGIR